jgi:hypothetical protein
MIFLETRLDLRFQTGSKQMDRHVAAGPLTNHIFIFYYF